MGTGNKEIYKNTQGALKPEHLMDELRRSGEKFTEENVMAVTKQKNGKIVWLEKGNESSGFIHILKEHGNDFENIGIKREQIVNTLIYTIKNGKIVGTQGNKLKNPRDIYEIEINGIKKYIAITVSKNGYIVGANPSRKDKIK